MISRDSIQCIMNGLLRTMVVLLIGVLSAGNMAGQGWERSFGGALEDRGHAIIQTVDRGYLMVGFSDSFGDDRDLDIYVVKTDVDGTLVWSNTYDEGFIEHGYEVVQTPDRGFLIVGDIIESANGSKKDVYLLKIAANGKFLWSKRFDAGGNDVGNAIAMGEDGEYLIVGKPDGTENGENDFLFIKTDDRGNEIWRRVFGKAKDDEANAVAAIAGGFVMVGNSENENGADNNMFVMALDHRGDELWSDQLDSKEVEEANDVTTTRDGGIAIVGTYTNDRQAFITKYDLKGKRKWFQSFGNSGLAEAGTSVIELPNGDLVLAGFAESNSQNVDFLLAGFTADGQQMWQNTTGHILNVDFSEDIAPTHDGGYVITGYNSKFLDSFNDLAIVKTDGRGNTLTSYISGNIYNEFCSTSQPAGTLPLEGWLVKAEGEETYFGSTDENGVFNIRVDTGKYHLTILPINSYWETCVPGGYNVNISQFYDTSFWNFPVTPEINCPYLEVDISTPFLAPCFEVVYTVNYCNLGTAVAEDAYVEVDFDETLFYESSSRPFNSQTGNKYRFDIGDIGVSECGSFTINTSLPCDGIANGQAALVTAHIFPDTICTEPDPNWDGSSIIVGGQCQGDSLLFFIRNTGSNDMVTPRSAIVIENDVILLKQDFKLGVNQQEFISVPSSSKTYRIIAEQSPGHPGRSYPTFALEGGCSGEGENTATGYVLQFPENDQDPFISVDAQEIIGFERAVELRGYPKGYGEESLLAPNTDLHYNIIFNNTGTDTLTRVVIRDTLPEGLDISTIAVGPSSHPYKFEVYDEGILKFTFNDISLPPGSSAQQPTSMGFVSFSISQKLDNPPGTKIMNSAAIFFENEFPAITNTVGHEIGTFPDFIRENQVVSNKLPRIYRGVQVSIQPNPFVDEVVFEVISNSHYEELEIELLDVAGRTVRKRKFNSKKFALYRGQLVGGLYFYRLTSKGNYLSSGKLIIE